MFRGTHAYLEPLIAFQDIRAQSHIMNRAVLVIILNCGGALWSLSLILAFPLYLIHDGLWGFGHIYALHNSAELDRT